MRLRLWILAFTLVVLPGLALPAAAGQKKKLNVLFIMSDDLRPELGCYGHSFVKTPNIDKLAKAGVRFERAYCQFPLCNPSRTSLLTGRHPTRTGVLDNLTWFGAAHGDWVSLPRFFRALGYVTLRTGKIFHGGIDDADAWTAGGEKRKFEGARSEQKVGTNYAKTSDRWVILDGDGEEHADYKIADRAIEYLRQHKAEPFFLACGFTRPHSPPTAPKKYFDMYDPARIPLPVDFASKPTVPSGYPKASVPAKNGDLFIDREASPEQAREMIRAYWASLTWVDWNVGRVLAELDRLGLREDTIIILWGDHGYHLGEKGKWSKHGSLFEVGTRVPLIVAAPGAKGNGRACPRVVQSLDLYPTLCELCGLNQPTGLQGHSLAPLLADPGAAWEHPAFSVFGRADRLIGVAVRTERFRYVEYDGGQGGTMLFEHPADPHELRNLADDPRFAQVRAELAALARQRADEFRADRQ
jgi:arylsulfatase A-like enzyme